MSSKYISIFLPDGDPLGIKMVGLGKQQLKGFYIPKSLISDTKSFSELNNPCLYLLCQRDGDEIYIGEAENFLDRIRIHTRQKDFWEIAIVFTGGVDKGEIKYLEHLAVKIAKDAGRYVIKNSKAPIAPKLHDFSLATMDDYFEDIKLLVSTLGFPVFDKVEVEKTREENIWYCDMRLNDVKAIDDGISFTILKDSAIDPYERPSYQKRKPEILAKRLATLKEKADFKDGRYILRENLSFASANQAGQFCLGGFANAWTTWKNKDGKTMDEVLRQNS